MMKKITSLFLSVAGLLCSVVKAQPSQTPQYPYIQTFDDLSAFQTIEGQYGWLNGNFFGIDPSTVSVYASRGIDGTQAMTTAINNFMVTDSILSPILGTFTAATQLSFYYKIVQPPPLSFPQTLSADGGLKLSILPYDGAVPEPEQELYRVSSTNHVDTGGYRKVTFPLSAFAGKIGHIKFSYYQGSNGDDYIIDIDSFVVNEPTITAIESVNSEKYVISVSEQNQILIKNKSLSNENSYFTIYDMNGRIIVASNNNYNSSVDASTWNKGLYLVQISDGKNTLNKKVLIR
jgi:hypothetical protein